MLHQQQQQSIQRASIQRAVPTAAAATGTSGATGAADAGSTASARPDVTQLVRGQARGPHDGGPDGGRVRRCPTTT